MIIVVNSPRIRYGVRDARDKRSGRGYSKTNIQTSLGGTTDLAGVALGGAGGAAVSFVAFDSAERTTILAEVAA